MKKTTAALAAIVLLCTSLIAGVSNAAPRIGVKASPPGQISVATVNARQNKILSLQRIEALFELSRAFRFRPLAFNGGTQGAVIAPDVVVFSEILEDNVNVFARFMRNKFDEPYEIVQPDDIQAAFMINTRTVELQGEARVLDDVCLNDSTTDKPRMYRRYPMATFREISTNSMFSVVGVHLSREYQVSGETDCLGRNVRAIRAELENQPGAAFIAGDFNFRPTQLPYECDPYEQGDPAAWWTLLTEPAEGERDYVDSVQWFHRARSLPMIDEWTYQHPSAVETCNGSHGVRRSRIDYIFASDAEVAEAHADHPGWTAGDNYKYSDHRFVLGRYVLTGPDRVSTPTATRQADGVIDLTWEPVTDAAKWIVYRARPGSDYRELAQLTAELTTFSDHDTEHDITYRYAVAAVGADSGQGIESPPAWETADARGPHLTGIVPGQGATGVSPTVSIRASFDEWVEASSVDANTISVYRNGNRIPGRVIRKGGFVIKFNPTFDLKKGETFTIVVRSVTDVLGNVGPVFKSRFETVEPPKKRRHRRR